jgi:predicted dehydrogenase
MNERAKIKVAIIGCGLIGTQWDDPDTCRPFSRTHAAAFTKNSSSELVAVCDQHQARAEQAAAVWGCERAFSDPARLFGEVTVDLLVVACSSDARLSVVEPALIAGVNVFVIEKPLATTLEESKKLVHAIEHAGVRSLVNFVRRWDPAMHALRERIASGAFGDMQRLVGYYGKGIANNGSHMVDLACLLCDALPVRARALGSPLDAREAFWSQTGNDPALDAEIVFAHADGRQFHLTMLGTDQRAFTQFELRVIGTNGFCDISRGGRKIMTSLVQDDPDFAGYRIPGEPQALQARYREAMDHMAHEAIQLALGRIEKSSCDARVALRTAMTVEAVKTSARQNGGWVDIHALIDETE